MPRVIARNLCLGKVRNVFSIFHHDSCTKPQQSGVSSTSQFVKTLQVSLGAWLRVRCFASGHTSCGFIDFTFALLLKIYLRFRGSFLRFHNTAGVTSPLTKHDGRGRRDIRPGCHFTQDGNSVQYMFSSGISCHVIANCENNGMNTGY